MLKMRTAPERERFDPPKVRRGLTSRSQNVHRATARAIRPTQSAQRVHFLFSKVCTAPQRERCDPPKVRRGFTLHSLCAPRHSESDWDHPKCANGSLCIFNKCTAPQREQVDPSKVLRLPRHGRASSKVRRLPRNLHEKLQSAAPATKSAQKALKCCTCH